jgi:histidyl-tRNA synthetase
MAAAGKDGLPGMKSQFKKADASGAVWALVFGTDELASGQFAVKNLRDPAAGQRLVPLVAAADEAERLLAAAARPSTR